MTRKSDTREWVKVRYSSWWAFLFCLFGHLPKWLGKCNHKGIYYYRYDNKETGKEYLVDQYTGHLWERPLRNDTKA